jgi:hypothetical protein
MGPVAQGHRVHMHCVAQGDQTSLATSFYTTRAVLIPGVSDTLPLFDLFYKRMLHFVYRCLNSQSSLFNFVTRHGIILFGQMDSVVGRNVLNCSLRYKTTIDCTSKLAFSSYNIDKYAAATEDVLNTNALLFELHNAETALAVCLTKISITLI